MDNKKLRLKGYSDLESNLDYIFTLKDKNENKESEDELENLDNKNVSRIKKDNNFSSLGFKDDEKNSDSIDLELNEKGEINDIDSSKIFEKLKRIKEKNNIGKEIDLNQNKKFENEYLTRDEFIKKQKKKKKKFKPSTLLIPQEEKNIKKEDLISDYFQNNNYINEDEMERLGKIENLKNENLSNENIIFKTLKEENNNIEKNEDENNLLNLDNIPIFKPRKNKKNENKKEKKNLINEPEKKINNNKIDNNNPKENNEINNINENNIKEVFNDDLGELEEIPTRKGVSIALYLFKQKKLINENETFGRYNDRDYKKELNNNIKNIILTLNNSNRRILKHTYSKGGKFNNIQTTYIISTSKSKSINLNKDEKNTILNRNSKAHYRRRNSPLNEHNKNNNICDSFGTKTSNRNNETMNSSNISNIHISEKNSNKNSLKYYQYNKLRAYFSVQRNKYYDSIYNYDYNARNNNNNNLTKSIVQTSFQLYNENSFYNKDTYNNVLDNNRYWNLPIYDNYKSSNTNSYNNLYNF
jgi:hypothetical protein